MGRCELWLAALAMLLAPSFDAEAACPANPETVRGSSAQDTLRGTTRRVTYFYGRGGRDTFVVERPSLFSFTGCTSRDYWDEIRDYELREIIQVPGTVERYRISGCLVQWQDTAQTHSGWYFVVISRCNLPKSDVVIR